MKIYEILTGLFSSSEMMILDFNQIPKDLPEYKNIEIFFKKSILQNINPKLPQNRQKFNNNYLNKVNKRYLISRYAEDRIEMLKGSKIAQEGRTIHLGIDIFSKNLEEVFAPLDGEIIETGTEPENHSFGYYLIFKPNSEFLKNYIFFGHLSKKLPPLGKVNAKNQIATLGDFKDGENGGWSRHLHVQLLSDLPKKNVLLPGYSSKENLKENMIKYPDPSILVFGY